MNYSFSELFNYFGGSLGIIISMIILLKMKGKPEIRVSLSLLMIVSSLIVILGAIMYSGKAEHLPFVIRIDSPLHYLFPPLCFIYVYASFRPGFRFRPVHLLHLLPFIINVGEFMPFYLSDTETKLEYYHAFLSRGTVVIPVHYYLKTISLTVYFFLGLLTFLRYKRRVRGGDGASAYLNSWFWIFFIGEAVLMMMMVMDSLSHLRLFGDPYGFMITMVTLFLISSTIAPLLIPQILYRMSYDPDRKKYIRSGLSDKDKDQILGKLESYFKDERPYLNPGVTLLEISKKLSVNPTRLSQVINEKTGYNFNDYINAFRIEEAKSLLSSDEYEKLTIDALSTMAGFNSKSPFYSAFRKHTGMTPREFVLNMRSSLV